jgi:hypothetical protein
MSLPLPAAGNTDWYNHYAQMDAQARLGASHPGYLISCFRAASGSLGGDEWLSIMWSQDGKTFWDGTYAPVYKPTPPKVCRDPSMIFRNNTWYICHTNTGAVGDSFDIISSTDLVHWSLLVTVDVSSIGGVTNTWAPEFTPDPDTGDMYIFFSINLVNTYWVKATNAALTTWTSPALLTVTNRPTQVIDPCFIKKDGTWYMFYKREDPSIPANRMIYRATSPTITGTYVTDKTGDWAGWGSDIEGPEVIQTHEGGYRMYFDAPNATTDLGSYYYSDSNDLETWTTKQSVGRFPGVPFKIRHAKALRVTQEMTSHGIATGLAFSSPRVIGKSPDTNQSTPGGVYLSAPYDGSQFYPGLYLSTGSSMMRFENSNGTLIIDRPGVVGSILEVNSGQVTFFGELRLASVATTTTAPAAGGAGALPATPLGYFTIRINGVDRKVPYYA